MLSQSLGITCQSLTDRWEDNEASYFNLMTSWTFLRLFGRSDDMEKKFNSFWNEIRLWILRVVLRRECRDGENDASAFEIWFHKAFVCIRYHSDIHFQSPTFSIVQLRVKSTKVLSAPTWASNEITKLIVSASEGGCAERRIKCIIQLNHAVMLSRSDRSKCHVSNYLIEKSAICTIIVKKLPLMVETCGAFCSGFNRLHFFCFPASDVQSKWGHKNINNCAFLMTQFSLLRRALSFSNSAVASYHDANHVGTDWRK